MIIDTHAHLGWKSFHEDRDQVVSDAANAGVERIITIGTDLAKSREAIQFTKQYPGVFAAVGIHPTDVCDLDLSPEEAMSDLREMLDDPKVVALGETGLDHFHPAPQGWSESDYHQRQVDFFEAHLRLAEETNTPVVVHQRDSHDPILEVLEPFHGRVRTVFHCWTQGSAPALELIEKGHRVSFTGIATFKNAPEVHEAATSLPIGSFFLETDSPFLAPMPHRGKRCQPAYTRLTGEHIAELREISAAQLFEETTAAAEEFFPRLKS